MDEMQKMSADDLSELVSLFAVATEADFDDLLSDLLVAPYPTKRSQDN